MYYLYSIIAVVFLSLLGIRIVRPTHRGLIERLGKYHNFAYPRFHWIIPIIDRLYMVNVTGQMVDAEPQEIITNDNLNARVDAQVYFRVKSDEESVKGSIYNVNNYRSQIVNLACTRLRNIIGTLTLKSANSEREDMILLSERLGLKNNKQWLFATTGDIEKMNQSVGFNPVWDSARSQYDHDAFLVGINKEGYVTKKLIGLRDKHELGLLISSVHDIFSPLYRLPNNNQLFSCFNYNPETGKNTPGLGLLFLALPAIIALLLVLGISYNVRHQQV